VTRKTQALEHLPATSRELAEAMGITKEHAYVLLGTMRKARLVHITAWTRETLSLRTRWRPIYAAGPGRDAQMPPRMSNAEACRRWKQRTTIPNSIFSLAENIGRVRARV
jgi:CheY-like chemotaxis protein